MNKKPKVSFIIPTLNSERTLEICLESINNQKYPPKNYEILICDGGSTDKTLEISKKFGAKIVKNKLKTAEAGKAVGVKNAKYEIIALVDSDNVLVSDNWLTQMLSPFKDKDIIASEPLYFNYDKRDHYLTRYFALLGMGDPLTLYIGNYDRFSYITNKWTNLDLDVQNEKGYKKIKLENNIPTIGANGFLIRKNVLDGLVDKYLFDIDILKKLIKGKSIYVAKVEVSITHLFTGDIKTFVRKQRRRIKDFMYYKNTLGREDSLTDKIIYRGVIKFIISCLLIFPILYQMIVGYKRKPDWAWLFHPIACYITLYVYSTETIYRSFNGPKLLNRNNWKQ